MLYEAMLLLSSRSSWFMGLLAEHLWISFLSCLLACILGLAWGIAISEYRRTSQTSLGLINFIYTIPSISLLGFLIPFSGIGNTTAVIALTVYALLPMVRNTYTGLTTIDPAILEAAVGMGSTRWQVLCRIKLPLAMPVILAGLRSMVTMTIALAGIASFIGAGGLGVAIFRGITTNNTAMTIAGSLLTALLALVMDFILGFWEKGWRRRKNSSLFRKRVLAAVLISLLVVSGGVFLSGKKGNTIHVATKPMTEQYILGEMLKLYIEQETGLSVKLTQGVGGGTSNIEPAMEKGDFDLYPEYTGTGWNVVLKEKGLYDESMFGILQQRYGDALHMEWVGMYGFNNTYGLAVRRDLADMYGLETYSDLARVAPQLTFGAEYDFYEREDGYTALCRAYGLSFGKTVDLDIGLKYQAIRDGGVDLINIFTTDGQLAASPVKVLQDDKHFYPSYRCGNVVRKQVLQAHPELQAVLERLSGTISDDEMARMNYQVEGEGQEPAVVARDFLVAKGLLRKGGV